LPHYFKFLFVFLEPALTISAAYSAFSAPEWYLANLFPGENSAGLFHTRETKLALHLYGVLLLTLALVSLAVFPVIRNRGDDVSFSVARRLLFVLAGKSFGRGTDDSG
jgi:hypothetical protein